MDLISIVVPCYNEEETIPLFMNAVYIATEKMKNDIEFEYVFIDDGSADGTMEVVQDLIKKDSRIKFISFSRNFGKEAAMYAGLEYAKGNYVMVMDVDLQDPPELIITMYDLILTKQYDCVATRRVSRKGEPRIRSLFARLFYKLINKISKIQIVDGARDFRMMTRQMVDSILELKEYNRFSKGIFSWVGFRTKWLDYENIERAAGETKWSFWKLFKYSMEGIAAFSTAPLLLASIIGALFCFIAFVLILLVVIKMLVWSEPVAGHTATVCAVFFIGGIQLFCIGILGQYLAKTYLETKKRPVYLIKETNL